MKTNRSVPPTTVAPVVRYPDVRAAVAWLSAAFGFVERTRIGEWHVAQMSVGEQGAVIVAESHDAGRAHQEVSAHSVRVRVEDVRAVVERACALGATVVEAPTEREYGEVECTLADPGGHLWQLAETVRDVAPEDVGSTTVSPWP